MFMRGNTILISLTVINILLFTYIFRSVKKEELDLQRTMIDKSREFDLRENNDQVRKSQGSWKEIKAGEVKQSVKRDLPLSTENIGVEQPPVETLNPPYTGPTPIILHTYMRSGSSFVGDLLNAAEGTFYTYEPVHTLQFTIRRLEPIRYLNRPAKMFNNFLDVAIPTVKDMITCQFSKLPFPYFEDGFFSLSTNASVFTQCNDKHRLITDTKKAYKCAEELAKECSKHSTFVTKIIRLPLYSLKELMEQLPNLKIIHLLRDPRPTMLSQIMTGNVKNKYLRANVTKYCNRVYDDVVMAEDFNRMFPGRLLRVHYEDIVKEPFEITRKMYEFAGIAFTRKASDTISKLTGSTEKQKSSDATASAWRQRVNMDFIRAVDTCCSQLYTKVGFQDMLSESDIRDVSKSLRGPPPPYDDFRLA
ncbi:carbohydrate sulfotransferase 1-like [Argopecten irradians]|uniref:carbohydrate sulfotransferase 1-like n=1 Tax=Argopecten irradians TaxID=31199 RepID=UPI003713C284